MSTFSSKNLILAGVYTAILIVAQLALSVLAGVEVVTVLLLAYCYARGAKQGVIVATSFSLIRCLLFGFAPNVLLLYVIYYNLFAVLSGFIGNCFNKKYSILGHVVVLLASVCLTICFTFLDCVITPLMYCFSLKATNAYFLASLPVVTTQIISAFASVTVLFYPILKLLKSIK